MIRKRKQTLTSLMVTLLFVVTFLLAVHLLALPQCSNNGNVDTVAVYMSDKDQSEMNSRKLGLSKIMSYEVEHDNLVKYIAQDDENFGFEESKEETWGDVKSKMTSNILANVSFDELVHIKPTGFNMSQFLNWTGSFLNTRGPQTFKMPKWFILGDDICDNKTELVILMPAVPEHQLTREIIRQTWASGFYGLSSVYGRYFLNTKLVFIVGSEILTDFQEKMLRKESEDYKDLIAAKMTDSYRNLTLKMLVGLNWVNRQCPAAKFVLKCDLDTFVNLPLMTKVISVISNKINQFIIGHKHVFHLPPVLRYGKWAITEEEYPFELFPPYVIGPSYVITTDLIPKMISITKRLPIIPSEDAHITGILATVLGVQRLHHPVFAHNEKDCLPCGIVYNEEVSMTKMDMSWTLLIWRQILLNQCVPSELPVRLNMLTRAQQSLLKDGQET